MSKILPLFPLIFAALVLILQFFTNADSQDIEAKIVIDGQRTAQVKISGSYAETNPRSKNRNLSFLRDYAGIANLGDRISDVHLRDEQWQAARNRRGQPVAFRQLMAGEYLAEGDFRAWNYNLNLSWLSAQSAFAHVSWMDRESGLLMLDDMLPQSTGENAVSAKITFELPQDWKIFTTETQIAQNIYSVINIEKAVFLIGKGWRTTDVRVGNKSLKFIMSGNWLFVDGDAEAMASEIYADYEKRFGAMSGTNAQIAVVKFPFATTPGIWEADTRGRSVTIVSSDMPFKAQSLQRLHEQLRHEIFHLWIPNGLNLSGNYDWFYEGFALYQSLKTGVAVNRIRFDDFLDTLSGAYEIDSMQSKRLSLIDVSKNRWSGSNTQVYARGMLVAFLCDLAMLEKSKGKRSVPDMLREIYERHRPPNPPQDGNSALIAILRAHSELVSIVDRYILGAESLDWTALLKAAGIEVEIKDQLTKLKVTAKPSGRQKDLLDKLGYNNWRKLSQSNR